MLSNNFFGIEEGALCVTDLAFVKMSLSRFSNFTFPDMQNAAPLTRCGVYSMSKLTSYPYNAISPPLPFQRRRDYPD